mmetsp:Transcript_18028/g.41329  ORF Transcript_18028/g.41329 Transcript_18028/m.41329 type:complete len:139 (-) Transcript_18028:1302-1718(-)
MSKGVTALISAIGGCDRVVSTPVPLSYSRHTSRSLTLWCGTLPFVLARSHGIYCLPAIAFICWCLFGIEEIGHLIEQPFRLSAASRKGITEAFWQGPGRAKLEQQACRGYVIRSYGTQAIEQQACRRYHKVRHLVLTW